MKHLVLKLDDIGCDANRPVVDLVLWAMLEKIPVSIGAIGGLLKSIPQELVEIVRTAHGAGWLELWNHGFNHLRYDQLSPEDALRDLVDGHTAIQNVFGIEPDGFGFPFNKFDDATLRLVRSRYPEYFVYESDLNSFKWVSPEFNVFADGQPRFERFLERVGARNRADNLILQAHPPRWSKEGFREFTRCVAELVEGRGYVCLKGRDAIESYSKELRSEVPATPVARVLRGIESLSSAWVSKAPEYTKNLSNFENYFLTRFNSDTYKNWNQVLGELAPFQPKRVLDLGCGLGNWSLPLWLSGAADKLVLNDVHPTIVAALKDGMAALPRKDGIEISGANLLSAAPPQSAEFDFLVSANTFNYLDPVEFFKFSQSAVSRGGRMLLMLQTPAFNRLRFRRAFELADRSTGVEALESDFAMLVRQKYGVFPTDVRHAYPLEEIERLAAMFDFTLASRFLPFGEIKEDGESVYECLLFRKMNNMAREIASRPDWLSECQSTVGINFGSKAFDATSVPGNTSTTYFKYSGSWVFPDSLAAGDVEKIVAVKDSLYSLRRSEVINFNLLQHVADGESPISEFAERVFEFSKKFS
ncbi:methyltransferase domain-containing protein [Achromobacter piechaudii]|uniref:NodB homology domain-containing protein n=1 Tax=Achromobacter piechaudii TaxID=72556 RepID=A0A6S7DPR2_9BURK|nr:methyltransferase domain-containing protein [Achromobacter piechaudii]CAB3871607.1 hypothetical protein LMG1861_02794 [Achromobacter piechaudii]